MGAGGVAVRLGRIFGRKLAGVGKGDPGDTFRRAEFDEMLAGASGLYRRGRQEL